MCHPPSLVRTLVLVAVSLNVLTGAVSAGKILLYPFAHCSNSHLLNFEKMAAILSEEHDVTMLLPHTYEGPLSKADLRKVTFFRFTVPNNLSLICSFDSLDKFLETSLQQIVSAFYKSTYKVCDLLLSNHKLLHTIKSTNFDLAIYDAVDMCSRVLADYIDVPFIVFNTQGLENILPRHPAYMPSLLSSFTNQMTLKERVLNTLMYMVQKLITHSTLSYYQELKLKHNVNTSMDVSETYNRASLRFILGDYGLDYVGPSQPSHILIGGYMQNTQVLPLQEEIADFIAYGDFSNVMVVSLGSMIKYYGPVWRELFASALAKVPYQVIWRYNDQQLPRSLGNNTLLLPWLPQSDLLALSNTKILVTHCGMNAIYEAAQNGVPIVGIPLYGDQYFQANKVAKHAGMGVVREISTMTSETLYDAIMQIHSNPEYQNNADRISFVLQNRPFSQKEMVLKWVNYVVKLNGTPHLHSQPYYELNWYQYFLCDVFLVISLLLIILNLVTLFLLTKLLQYLYHRILTFGILRHVGAALVYIQKALELPLFIIIRTHDVPIQRNLQT